MNDKNPLWNFFASVKLALFTLCTLSLTSIVGTVIPQHQQFGFYAQRYGEGMARFFYVLDIHQMYGSWWFLGLLGLLSANLIICSIDRFPFAWKQIVTDPASTSVQKIEKMANTVSLAITSPHTTDQLESILKGQGYATSTRNDDKKTIIAGQKGGWTRTGVYIVHLSILVIFLGAIVGHFLGFKGSVMIPETKKSSNIYSAQTNTPIPLGFEVRCDSFAIDFYENGMVKEYTSRLTVLEGGEEVLVKDIEVNAPLKYKGITFYQSSYEGYRDFVIKITPSGSSAANTFIAPFQQQINWDKENITFGIVNAEAIRDRVVRAKVWFKAGDSEPVIFWIDAGGETVVDQPEAQYAISVKQMYATGLQVAKDPGVWIVYLGCFLMMFGLYLAFFMSHQRVWLVVDTDKEERQLLVAGTTNKNKIGFEKSFNKLTDTLSETVY